MPLQFKGILHESRVVRNGLGLFDVSHMLRVVVEGPQAVVLLDWIHSNDIGNTAISRSRYGVLCNERGGIIDDGIVYRLDEQRFLLVTNAANAKEVLAWLHRWQSEQFPRTTITDVTHRQGMIACQGPRSLEIVESVIKFDVSSIRPFWCTIISLRGREIIVARTGYTGEEGVEIILPSDAAPWLWGALIDQGAVPCGLGARDILRLEAGLLLHGMDMDQTTNPIEAGLERFISFGKGEFYGVDAIRRAWIDGVERRLTGFRMIDRGIPRHDYSIMANNRIIGRVTSGAYSPALDMTIGLGYVPTECTYPGTHFQIDLRGKSANAQAVSLPFYSRLR